jgi:putative oxidoreductase
MVVGYGFMQHGVAKLLKGPDAFAAILQGIGVPGPHLMAWLTILTEVIGGFGRATRGFCCAGEPTYGT